MKVLATILFLCSGLLAQAPIAATPFVSDGVAYAVVAYDDGTTKLASTNGETTELASKDGEFVSEFTDSNGVTHTVRTPKGKKAGSVKAALERHAAALKLMRATFP